MLARGSISIAALHELIASAPQSPEQLGDAQWRKESLCWRLLAEANARELPPETRQDLLVTSSFFLQEFCTLAPKTRSVSVSCVGAMTDPLLRGMCRTLFCTDTTLRPGVMAEGKIIVIDMPVRELREVGLIGNTIWKLAFQRWAERRDITANPRPVFAWLDEAAGLVTRGDAAFQSTCRSSRVATVMLGQNVAGFYAALGSGEACKAEADSLFGNLATKIFHAHGDPQTNEWASQLCGRSRQFLMSGNRSRANADWPALALGVGDNGQHSAGFSEQWQPQVEPGEFVRLRTGGPQNDWLADTIIFKSGPGFAASGRNWLKTTFSQRPSP